jgi:hypothetical protein
MSEVLSQGRCLQVNVQILAILFAYESLPFDAHYHPVTSESLVDLFPQGAHR